MFAALTRGLLAAAIPVRRRVEQPARKASAEFYKGKTVEMLIGYSAGGGYDVMRAGRAPPWSHIPGNPTVTPKNMPGAGSLRLANWL